MSGFFVGYHFSANTNRWAVLLSLFIFGCVSRKAVGWKAHYAESAENASELITEICLREGIKQGQLATHADNGGSMKGARAWVTNFIKWYNTVHLHSGISFTTPELRHFGLDVEILSKREVIYANAKAKNLTRWSGKTRNWKKITEVRLNCLMDDGNEITTPFSQAVS